jgi:hypothetical protein
MFQPFEADPPLVVDAYAPLPRPIATEFLQPVRRRNPQIMDRAGIVDHAQLPHRHLLDIQRQSTGGLALIYLLRQIGLEGFDHNRIIWCHAPDVNHPTAEPACPRPHPLTPSRAGGSVADTPIPRPLPPEGGRGETRRKGCFEWLRHSKHPFFRSRSLAWGMILVTCPPLSS